MIMSETQIDVVSALEQQLKERIAALDSQRREEAEKFQKEMSDRNALAEAEREERIKAYNEASARRLAKEKAEKEAEQERKQREIAQQKKLESSLAAADEAKAAVEARLKWLVEEIAKQEFVEEQHRKQVESINVAPSESSDPTEINVEHPVAPLNSKEPGAAVEGTEGKTPDSPLMSSHLKQVLRQATRQY
jgi:hypothetical protein